MLSTRTLPFISVQGGACASEMREAWVRTGTHWMAAAGHPGADTHGGRRDFCYQTDPPLPDDDGSDAHLPGTCVQHIRTRT